MCHDASLVYSFSVENALEASFFQPEGIQKKRFFNALLE